MEQTFSVFGHHVRPYGKIGRTMSDDRLLFPALLILTVVMFITVFSQLNVGGCLFKTRPRRPGIYLNLVFIRGPAFI